MLSKLVGGLDRLTQRFTPDPLVFAILLTFIAMLLGVSITDTTGGEIIESWGKGFWGLLQFTMQMVMILLCGYIVARSKPVEVGLRAIVKQIRTPLQAVIATTIISCLASWLNWGFGLVVGAIFALEVARVMPKCNFRLLVASAYSGFIVWHGGLSGSIPLSLNTDGVAQKWVDKPVPLDRTIFSDFNLTALAVVIICLIVTNVLLHRASSDDDQAVTQLPERDVSEFPKPTTVAEHLEATPIIPLAIGAVGITYIGYQIADNEFKIDLNRINFIFLFLGLILHGRLRNFLGAVREGASKVGPILIQYPFYAGIMTILTTSGLAAAISLEISSLASETTFPLFTFFGAGLVNVFVPSGGGQWAVQAPVVLPGLAALGADFTKSIMAVAWGDAWTNLLQPFWALPLLAIAGLKIKHILGFCLVNLFVTGVALSILFVVF